jgi:hypothetical protein
MDNPLKSSRPSGPVPVSEDTGTGGGVTVGHWHRSPAVLQPADSEVGVAPPRRPPPPPPALPELRLSVPPAGAESPGSGPATRGEPSAPYSGSQARGARVSKALASQAQHAPQAQPAAMGPVPVQLSATRLPAGAVSVTELEVAAEGSEPGLGLAVAQ